MINITKQFEIRSRSGAEKFTCDKPWAAISISEHRDGFPELSKENRVGLLQLCFWDIVLQKEITDKHFSKEQAKQLLEFVESIATD